MSSTDDHYEEVAYSAPSDVVSEDSKKKGFVGRFFGLPGKVKAMMVILAGLAGAFIYLIFSSLSTPPAFSSAESQGAARVDVRVDKVKSTDNRQAVKSDTATSDRLEALHEEDIETRRQSSDSFIEQIELRNAQAVEKELNKRSSQLEQQAATRPALNSESTRRALQARQAEIEERRARLASTIANQQNPESPTRPAQRASSPSRDGYYYYDEKGEIQLNQRPISQSDLMEMQQTGRVFDEESFIEEQMAMLQKNSNRNLNIDDYTAFRDVGSMASSFDDDKDDSKGSSSSDRTSRTKVDYASYFERGSAAVSDERSRMRGLQASLTGGSTQPDNAAGPANTGGGVSELAQNPSAGGTRFDVPPGTIRFGNLQIGVNSDAISPVKAVILQEGPLKGAELLGAPAKISEEAVGISFTTMTVGKQSYTIDAVALDPQTYKTHLADDVDHHTFERYFKLATAAAMEGYAEALTNQRTIRRSDGSVETVNDGLPDGRDQALYATGKIGEKLVPKYESAFDRESTVTVNSYRDIAVMFMSGVNL